MAFYAASMRKHLTEKETELEKERIKKIAPVIHADQPLRWGIVGAGLVSNDFTIAVQELSSEVHQVSVFV